MILRFFALLMIPVFGVFAYLQYNDPDPYIWIPIYLYLAGLSYLAFAGRGQALLFGISALVFLAGALYLFPYNHWEGVALKNGMKTRFIEEGRESLGLGIGFLTLLVYWIDRRVRRKVRAI